MSSKGGRTKYKDKERQEVGMEIRPGKGVLKEEKIPNTRKHSHRGSVGSFGLSEGNITRRKNK